MTLTDEELDTIRKRDWKRKRRTGRKSRHKCYDTLCEILKDILYQPGVNNGNVYHDSLAAAILKDKRIKYSL